MEPRFVAAGGLIALGAGVGITLMLAHILILLGLLLALASAIGVICIYWRHFSNIYHTLKNKKKYNGPSVVELLIAVVIVTIVVIISPIIYSNVQSEEVLLNRASMTIHGISPFKVPGGDNYFINVQWDNHGSLPLTDGAVFLTGLVSSKHLSKQEIDEKLVKLEQQLVEQNRTHKPNLPDIFPGQSGIVTIPDLAITNEEWTAITQGVALLYVIYVLSYQDDAIRSKAYWHGKFCLYFTYNQVFYHNCDQNHVERITGPRYQ